MLCYVMAMISYNISDKENNKEKQGIICYAM